MLRKSLPTNSLAALSFSVIGLGDSSYQKFNFVAKRLHKRLCQLGATAIQPVGLCDDQHDLGIGAVLFPWMDSFWQKLLELKPLPIELSPLDVTPRILRWDVKNVQTFMAIDDNIDIYSKDEETSADGYVEVLVSYLK